MRVIRVYHAGRDPAHRARERALAGLGVDVTLVVPSSWPEHGAQATLSDEPFRIVELDVRRAGDVNRHRYEEASALSAVLDSVRPDVLDLHEEPVSLAARQWLRAAGDVPVCMYTAQNVDKRFPPPFAQYETAAYRRVDALYPCTRQAAAVARGKGFSGLVEVLALGVDSAYRPGRQFASPSSEVRLGIVGRLVAEKGVQDAVRVLAAVRAHRPARLLIVGQGPEEAAVRALAQELRVADAVEFRTWRPLTELARIYRDLDVVLVPSRATETWVEQFGRIILEAQASGALVAGYASGAIAEVGGEAALLVPEGDVGGLAEVVRTTLEDEERCTLLRKAGLRRAREASWPSVAARQARLYEDVVARREPLRSLPPRATARRRAAVTEFGPTASLVGGSRPFALPVLRRDARWTRLAGQVLDAAGHAMGR